jgi:hypothetical protein
MILIMDEVRHETAEKEFQKLEFQYVAFVVFP